MIDYINYVKSSTAANDDNMNLKLMKETFDNKINSKEFIHFTETFFLRPTLRVFQNLREAFL